MNCALERKKAGLSCLALRSVGFILLLAGAVGKAVFENTLLGDGGLDSSLSMTYAAAALSLQAISTAAVPVFVFLLLQGFENTKSIKKYLLRLTALAAISEIPYNLAMSGRLLDSDSRNPVFALVLCLSMLYFYGRYGEKGAKNTAVKAVVTLCAFSWALILSVDEGIPVILLCAVLFAFRKKESFCFFAGTAALAICTAVSPFYMFSPFAFILLHFYNGNRGGENTLVNYLSYPAMLLCVGAAAMMI